MASIGEVFVHFRANTTQFQSSLKAVSARMKALRAQALTTGKAIGTAFNRIGAVSAVAAGGSIKVWADFEKQLASVSTMVGSNVAPTMERFKGALREMAVRMGESTSTLSKGLYDILSASVPVEHALDVLEVAAKAAAAGMTDTGTAADVITTMLNSYNLDATEAGRVSDILFGIVKRGKTTFPELAQSIGMVSTTAAKAGVTMEQLAGMYAVLTRNGINTQIATTGIRAVMTSFLNPTKDAAEAARAVGFELNSATLRSKGLPGVLAMIADIARTNPDALTKMFPNVRAVTALIPAAANAEALAEDVAAMGNSAGATEEAFKKMQQTTAFAFGQMKQAVVVAMGAVGEGIMAALAEMGLSFENFTLGATEKFIEMGRGIGRIIGQFVNSFKTLGPVLTNALGLMGRMVKAVANFISQQPGILAAFLAFKIGTMTGLIPAVTSTISLIGKLVMTLTAMLLPSLAATEGGFLAMAGTAQAAWATATMGISVLIAALAGLVVYLFSIRDKIYEFVGGTNGSLAKVWRAVKDYLLAPFRVLADLWNSIVVPAARTVVAAFTQHLLPALGEIFTIITTEIIPVFTELYETIWQEIKPIVMFLAKVVVAALVISLIALAKLLTNVVAPGLRLFAKVLKFVMWVVGKVIKVALTPLQLVCEGLKIIVTALVDGFKEVVKWAGKLLGLSATNDLTAEQEAQLENHRKRIAAMDLEEEKRKQAIADQKKLAASSGQLTELEKKKIAAAGPSGAPPGTPAAAVSGSIDPAAEAKKKADADSAAKKKAEAAAREEARRKQQKDDLLSAQQQDGSLNRRLEATVSHGTQMEAENAKSHQRILLGLRMSLATNNMTAEEYQQQLARLDASFQSGKEMAGTFSEEMARDFGPETMSIYKQQLGEYQQRFLGLQQSLNNGSMTLDQYNAAVSNLKNSMDQARVSAEAASMAEQRRANMAGKGKGFEQADFQRMVQDRIIQAQTQRFSRMAGLYANRLMATTPGLQHLAQNTQRAGSAAGGMAQQMQKVNRQMKSRGGGGGGGGGGAGDRKAMFAAMNSRGGIIAGLMARAQMVFSKAAVLSGRGAAPGRGSAQRARAGRAAQAELAGIMRQIQAVKNWRPPTIARPTMPSQFHDPGMMTANRGGGVSVSLPNVTRVNNEDIRNLADRLDQEMARRGRQVV